MWAIPNTRFLAYRHTCGMATKKSAPKVVREDICVRFGRLIRELRTERGWKQADLSAYTGIDRAFLSRLETGSAEPCLRSLETLAGAFEIPLPDLFRRL